MQASGDVEILRAEAAGTPQGEGEREFTCGRESESEREGVNTKTHVQHTHTKAHTRHKAITYTMIYAHNVHDMHTWVFNAWGGGEA